MLRAALIASGLLSAATPALADDFPPGPGTTGGFVGDAELGLANGTIDYPGDVDAFRIDLPQDGRAFAFAWNAPCHTRRIKLYDKSFHILATSTPTGSPDQEAVVEWRPKYAGRYYVQVTDLPFPDGYECAMPGDGSYDISVGASCLGGLGTACTLQGDSVRTGVLRGLGDRDWISWLSKSAVRF